MLGFFSSWGSSAALLETESLWAFLDQAHKLTSSSYLNRAFHFLFFGGWELFLEAGKTAFIIRPEACACVLQSVSNLHTTVPI